MTPACWSLKNNLHHERQRDDLAILLDGFGHGILVVYERSLLAGRVALCCRAPAQLIVFDELRGTKLSSVVLVRMQEPASRGAPCCGTQKNALASTNCIGREVHVVHGRSSPHTEWHAAAGLKQSSSFSTKCRAQGSGCSRGARTGVPPGREVPRCPAPARRVAVDEAWSTGSSSCKRGTPCTQRGTLLQGCCRAPA